MVFGSTVCAVAALALVSLAHGQGIGNIFIVEAGTNGTVEPMQENGTTTFCPTKYTGGFNIECTHPGDRERILFYAKGQRIRIEKVAPYYLGGNNGPDVFPWRDWKKHVDADNVLTLTCEAPDKDGVRTNHTAKIKFACPLPPKEDCVTITAADVVKDSLGLTSGQWKMRGNSIEYVGGPMKGAAPASELKDNKVAITFPFLGTVTSQQLCAFDLTTPAKPNQVALFMKSDSGYAFSTDAVPIDEMLTFTWLPVYYDKVNMGQTKVGTKMYPLITASMREGMEVRFSFAGKVKGTIFHNMTCVKCDGDICTPDTTYIKRALARCGM